MMDCKIRRLLLGVFCGVLVFTQACAAVAPKQKEEVGPQDLRTAARLNHEAILNHCQGKYAEAELLYKRSLEIRVKSLGTNHRDVAQSLNNLAALYRTQGKYTKSEPLY